MSLQQRLLWIALAWLGMAGQVGFAGDGKAPKRIAFVPVTTP